MVLHVLIIGGGASGLTAAIAAARQGAQVTVLEHMDRVGKKILSTGNGRCNLTNLVMNADCYRCSQKSFPMDVIDRFSVSDTLAFFHDLGILTKDRNGYVYPNSEQAAAVLDALRLEVEALGITVITGCHILSVKQKKGSFMVTSENGIYKADRLILATGSKAAPVTGSDGSGYPIACSFGHRLIQPLPALVQLRCNGPFFKQVSGVRCEARVMIKAEGLLLAQDRGELQLTDYGISGIPTFQVSRYAARALAEHKKVIAVLDFLPSMDLEETKTFILNRKERLGDRPGGEFLTGVLHKKLAGALYKIAGFSSAKSVGAQENRSFDKLIDLLKCFTVEVTATNSFEQAQICCGGIDTRDIDASTMESKLVKGLYMIGELLDVDGICGGYNLQWAWSTGMLAGIHAGREER